MGAPTDDEVSQYEGPQLLGVRDSLYPDILPRRLFARNVVFVVLTCVLLYGSFAVLVGPALLLPLQETEAIPIAHKKPCDCSTPTPDVPQYFQTSPELWAGPTATGRAPFLAQTNPVSFAPTATFVPNNPLETAEPIIGQGKNESIFRLMGNLSPYFSNPTGFGVSEYPLPPGANITQVQVYLKPSTVSLMGLIVVRCSRAMEQDIPPEEAMYRLLVTGLQTKKGNIRQLALFRS